MAATTAQIRAALASAVATGLGNGWQVSGYILALPSPPSVDVRPAGIDFDLAMHRGLDMAHYIVRPMVAFNNDQGSQVLLDALLDTTSAQGLKTIIETDKTLGGVVEDLRVESVSDYKGIEVAGQPPLLTVEFTVGVYP